MQAEEIGARQTAAHENTTAGRAYIRVIGCADRDGQIEILVFENGGPPAEPMLHNVADALAKDLRDEEAAVKQNSVEAVFSSRRSVEKLGEMAGDGGIRYVRQTQFAEHALLLLLGLISKLAGRQKSTKSKLQELFTRDAGLERSTDQRRARARDGDIDRGWPVRGEQTSLLRPSTDDEARYADGETASCRASIQPARRW